MMPRIARWDELIRKINEMNVRLTDARERSNREHRNA
jgi:hypothetical protein